MNIVAHCPIGTNILLLQDASSNMQDASYFYTSVENGINNVLTMKKIKQYGDSKYINFDTS